MKAAWLCHQHAVFVPLWDIHVSFKPKEADAFLPTPCKKAFCTIINTRACTMTPLTTIQELGGGAKAIKTFYRPSGTHFKCGKPFYAYD